MLQDTYENRLHLRKTQINLVFHSIYTIFALRFAKGTVPDVKIERDIYETRNQKRPWWLLLGSILKRRLSPRELPEFLLSALRYISAKLVF